MDNPRLIVSYLKGLGKCADALQKQSNLPDSLCYVPSVIKFKVLSGSDVKLYEEHNLNAKKKEVIKLTKSNKEVILISSGEDIINENGHWMKIVKVILGHPKNSTEKVFESECWALIYNTQLKSGDTQPIAATDLSATSWRDVVAATYSNSLCKSVNFVPPNQQAVKLLQCAPLQWGLEHDEELVRFLTQQQSQDSDFLGSVSSYLEDITVSSEPETAKNLTDDQPDTFWESDGEAGQHWVRLNVKKGVIIKKLYLVVDGSDDNYMPHEVVVMGGETGNLRKLNQVIIHHSSAGCEIKEVLILEEMRQCYRVIEIQIKECHEGGIDTRLHGIKIRTQEEKETGPSVTLFTKDQMVRYPLLEPFSPLQLAKRATALYRFTELFDICLPYIFPKWEYSSCSFDRILAIRQILPLSKKRLHSVGLFLKDTETSAPSTPKVYINRRLAAEHREAPDKDPNFKNSVFKQIYEGLKPKSKTDNALDYRWPHTFEQWWECKFISEGIIDQGGGFRDSLCDLANELCPGDTEAPVPLPFFIPTPNQFQQDSNINRDTYVPNPSCRLFAMYEWIGQLMGACIRSQEHIVLSLPSYTWKMLTNETVSWSRDYASVDLAEVQTIDSLELLLDEEEWAVHGGERCWSVTLSDGTHTPLLDRSESQEVRYNERAEYCEALRRARMMESEDQIAALRRGLLRVIPQAVLDLLTWQELEKRVCGSPEIPVDSMKRSTHYDDIDESDQEVKILWQVLERFSDEDRSRFLRFVTGRRRLPAPLYICAGESCGADTLPKSSTCSNTLYLPPYSSVKVAEERVRYAIYNCLAIDTDMSPWEE